MGHQKGQIFSVQLVFRKCQIYGWQVQGHVLHGKVRCAIGKHSAQLNFLYLKIRVPGVVHPFPPNGFGDEAFGQVLNFVQMKGNVVQGQVNIHPGFFFHFDAAFKREAAFFHEMNFTLLQVHHFTGNLSTPLLGKAHGKGTDLLFLQRPAYCQDIF